MWIYVFYLQRWITANVGSSCGVARRSVIADKLFTVKLRMFFMVAGINVVSKLGRLQDDCVIVVITCTIAIIA